MEAMAEPRKAIIIKKHPMELALLFVLIEIASTGLFFLLARVADYGEAYEAVGFARVLGFNIAEIIGAVFAETAIVLGTFAAWWSATYAISPVRITYTRGLVMRRATTVAMADVHAVSVRQGILGRVLHYGTLEIFGAAGTRIGELRFVPQPQHYANTIMRYKQAGPAADVRAEFMSVDAQVALSSGEHEQLEFKETLRWDVREGRVNKALEKAVLKTVAAFMNSRGGALLIGVGDDRKPVGLARDYATLRRRDADGFETHFSNIFRTAFGASKRQYVRLSFPRIDGVECCLVQVAPAPHPVYLAEEKQEEFFVRTGNSTTSLTFSEAAAYITSRFNGRLL